MKTALMIGALLAVTLPAQASDIYQITDEKGRKTFTNIAPPENSDAMQRVELRSSNISHDGASNHQPDNDRYFEEQQAAELESREISQRLNQDEQQAYETLQQARENLEKAREIQTGDYFNIPGKGLRYNAAYHERIQHAEQQVQTAQENYDRIRQRAPASNNTLPAIDELFPEPQ